MGDSNFGPIKFGSGKGKVGESTPGTRVFTPTINSIDPIACASYRNVVLMVGTNDLKVDYVDDENKIRQLYKVYKSKISLIKKHNTKCKIIVCPVLPTKCSTINRKIDIFNSFLFTDLLYSNMGVTLVEGFGEFWDHHTHLLKDSLSKPHDELHLNDGLGVRVLVKLLKDTIFRHHKKDGGRRNYADTVRGGPPPRRL